MTPDRLSLLAVARKRLGMEEGDWRQLLHDYAGVSSARALDDEGFDRVTARLRQLGFTSDYWQAGLGDRRDMASPHQVNLILDLWKGAVDDPTPDYLRAFLSKRFGVGDVRFLSAAKAPKVITALKAMQARRNAKSA